MVGIVAATRISIHAPARGATGGYTEPSPADRFQSTLPQGERLVFVEIFNDGTEFQSTLPQGERPAQDGFDLGGAIFQSTLPQGERHKEFNW